MDLLPQQGELEVSFTDHDWKLRFSITLGFGSQQIRGDDGIYINSIEDGSPIAVDGRIWVGDRIVAVRNGTKGNRICLIKLEFKQSVDILKKACRSRDLVLIVKKCEIDLRNRERNEPLGFLILGGIDNEFIPGDGRIYISRIFDESNTTWNGRLSIGDRLLGVRPNYNSTSIHSDNFISMDLCTQVEAVSVLKDTQKRDIVSLMICQNDDLNFHCKIRYANTC